MSSSSTMLLAILGLASCAHRASCQGDYRTVPEVTALDPSHLRDLLLSSQQSIVRVGIFGDSQEASPDSWGAGYVMESSALLAEAFGPASETIAYPQTWWNTVPNWLAATLTTEPSQVVPPQIDSTRLPPSFRAVARTGPWSQSDAFTVLLMPKAERCPVPKLVGGAWFLDGPEVRFDVLVSRRTDAGQLRWKYAVTQEPWPSPWATVQAEGLVPGVPSDPVSSAGWHSTPTLPRPGTGFRQVMVSGADAALSVDVVAGRFRNHGASRGVILQPLAVGGASLVDLTDDHGASGPIIKALGLHAVILHYGANDAAMPLDAWRQRMTQSIALIRSAFDDPRFPIIIASDPHRRNLPPGSAYGMFPVVAHELALQDDRLYAFNLRRIHEERFGWNDAQNFGLADAVHHRPHGQSMMARALVSTLLTTCDLPVPGCAQGMQWSDCFHPLGASCLGPDSCSMLVEADAAFAGRPFLGGATCDDGDLDGLPDACSPPNSPDLDGDGVVGGSDLGILLTAWGTIDPDVDLSGDRIVDGADLGQLLTAWGPLP